MKKVISLLCGVVFLASHAGAQDVFYDEKTPLSISENPNQFILHFENEADYTAASRQLPEGFELLKSIDKYLAMAINVTNDLSNEGAIINALNLSDLDFRSIDHSWQLEDGFNLWLSYEILYEPKVGVSIPQAMPAALSQYGATIRENEFGRFIMTVNEPRASLLLANTMVESGLVNWAHPNFYANHVLYNDPYYSQQFQMNNTGQTISGVAGMNDVDCDAAQAWGITTGSASITVAVIDDGLEAHEDMKTSTGASRILGGYTPSNNGNGNPNASGAHGMACAGIIGASHNTIGVRGVAPGVKLRSVNIFNGGETTSDLASAFTWAKNQNADVISNSWGYPSCFLSLSALNTAINDARQNGRGGDGCVILFAAGNSYGDCIEYPADLTTVMAVGAVTNLGTHSNYSNTGPALDVVAPSNSAPGQSGAGVRTIDREGSAGYSFGDYTTGFGGTSAACPVVAGVAALILSYDATLTETEVRNLLTNTATDMGSSGFDNTYGHGRVSAFDALTQLGAGAPQVENCTSTFNSFPHNINFNSAIGGWSQNTNDDLDWTRRSGPTPTTITGPSDSYEGSHYLYIEASTPNFPSKTATVSSQCYNIAGLNNPAVSFAYNMNGAGMGNLYLEASTDGSTWAMLWSALGDQGSDWLLANISLSAYANQTELKLRFRGVTGSNYDSDIAIDDVRIGTQVFTTICTSTVSAFPFTENFESSSISWTQGSDDDLEWNRIQGGTPSSTTGPDAAAQGNYYYYVEASAPNYPAKDAKLVSPCLDLTSVNTPEINFQYHMLGSAVGTLRLEAKVGSGSWQNVWFDLWRSRIGVARSYCFTERLYQCYQPSATLHGRDRRDLFW